MKRLAVVLASVGALLDGTPGTVWAQESGVVVLPAPAQSDPVRLDLARRLVELSGGREQAAAQMSAVFGAIKGGLAKDMPADQSRVTEAIFDDMSQQMLKITPQLLDLTVRIYAENFTERELQDLIAFQTSDSGQSIRRKMPLVQSQAVTQTLPLIMRLMPETMRHAVDRSCEENHCSARQREALAKAFTRALPQPAS